MKRSMYPLITEYECVCLDCDWEGFTGDCVTEDGHGCDGTLQCPLCLSAVQVTDPEFDQGKKSESQS